MRLGADRQAGVGGAVGGLVDILQKIPFYLPCTDEYTSPPIMRALSEELRPQAPGYGLRSRMLRPEKQAKEMREMSSCK